MVTPAFRPKKILWMDLEMSGLAPREDVIIEIAVIVTDWNFEEIATYEAVVKQDKTFVVERMKIGQAFWDESPEARDALVSQNDSGKSPRRVEAELLTFINKHFERGTKVLLAGNSIHQDRQFIDFWWPKLSERLHYRMLDVSAWKVVFFGKYRKKFSKKETHRALNDVRGSIEELKYYLAKVKI